MILETPLAIGWSMFRMRSLILCLTFAVTVIACDKADGQSVTVQNLESCGPVVGSRLREERIAMLKSLALPAGITGEASYELTLKVVNQQLARKGVGYKVAVEVDRHAESWWKEAKKTKLASVVATMNPGEKDVEGLIRRSNLWSILDSFSLALGTQDPFFMKGIVVFSLTKGYFPRELPKRLK